MSRAFGEIIRRNERAPRRVEKLSSSLPLHAYPLHYYFNIMSLVVKERPFKIIGELMNNSFARARRAWEKRDLEGYRHLARLQTDLGTDYMTLNLGGTHKLKVQDEEMLAFLPDLVPAIQEVTSVPISFDYPGASFHKEAFKHWDFDKSPGPILNSVAASRPDLNEMLELIAQYDTNVIVMASEKFTDQGGAPCLSAQEKYETCKKFVEILRTKTGRKNDQIIVDPGLAPVGADISGLINMSLDTMRLIRRDPDLEGLHIIVGLTNFSFGSPKGLRIQLEKAYLTLALEAGLDFVLGNPEKDLETLEPGNPILEGLRKTLEAGRPKGGESLEDAGYRQTEEIMKVFSQEQKT